MDKLPFAVYDFFGYLASGFLVWACLDYSYGSGLLIAKDIPAPTIILWVLVVYISGQILANISAYVIERTVVGKILGQPNVNLFEPRAGLRTKLFPGFYTLLPEDTRRRVFENAKVAGIEGAGEALFFHAFATVKRDTTTMRRLDTFLNQYGFARNIAFALMCGSPFLAWTAWYRPDTLAWKLTALALVGAVGMFYRYLKFSRQYSVEVFVTYAESGGA